MEQRIKKNIQEVKSMMQNFMKLNDTEVDEDTTSNIEDNTNKNASEMHVDAPKTAKSTQ